MWRLRTTTIGVGFGWLLGCGGTLGPTVAPPPPAQGPLEIRVVHPPPLNGGGVWRGASGDETSTPYRLQSRDSAFVFGSVGRGDARLLINGEEVPVAASGGWLAWLPLPDDTVVTFHLNAVAGTEMVWGTYRVPLPPRFVPPETPVWIDTTSFRPAGDRWVRPGEGSRFRLRASPGAQVRVLLPTGDTVQFRPEAAVSPPTWGQDAFAVDGTPAHRPALADRYHAWWAGGFGPDPGHVMSPDWMPSVADSSWAVVEAVMAGDTARARWPLRQGVIAAMVPPLVVVDDDTARTGQSDSILAGRPTPFGTYHWFFPTGTVATVSGRHNSQVRLQLSTSSVAWVDVADVQPLPPGTPPPGGVVRPPRLFPADSAVTLRVPLPARIPFRVDETEFEVVLRLYGVAADMDWIQYSGTDPFVQLIAFDQPMEDEVTVTVRLDRRVWGYRTRWDGTNLLLEIRRPPPIDAARPLAGRLIAVDAGHPPGGSTGPTGVREYEVTLPVAEKVRTLLEEAGARVMMLRTTMDPVDLAERVTVVGRSDAELLVSIHANALPDGVNPFANAGTSVYYYHPRSVELARALNEALVAQFGVRDLGIGRGDLAMVRPTWMPAALTEGLFMMLPEQEQILASDAGQWRYARGVVEGIERFLRGRAGR